MLRDDGSRLKKYLRLFKKSHCPFQNQMGGNFRRASRLKGDTTQKAWKLLPQGNRRTSIGMTRIGYRRIFRLPIESSSLNLIECCYLRNRVVSKFAGDL